VSTAGVALLIAVTFSGLVAEPHLVGGGIGRRVFGPVLLTVIAAVPAAPPSDWPTSRLANDPAGLGRLY
jgi:hypothetical protein